MPRRKRANRSQLITDHVLDELRTYIRTGYPWTTYGFGPGILGDGDVNGLITGMFFFPDFLDCQGPDGEENDEETQRLLWESLKGDILSEHIKHAPGTRPWAWWKFDAPEKPRVVGVDPDADDDGYLYESSREYLERHNLLTADEKAILEKFGSIVRVRISAAADVAKCAPCWAYAHEIASEIGFDIDGAIQFKKFWIPAALYFVCDHEKRYHGNDCIFEEL